MTSNPGPWLVVGLGNPGAKFSGTRHNVGFGAVDSLVRTERITFSGSSGAAEVGVCRNGDLVIAKPTTFVNASGDAVRGLMQRFGIGRDRVIVIHDDVHVEAGDVDVVVGVPHGGHNGVASVMDRVGSNRFVRIRVGVGGPAKGRRLEDHVLERPGRAERKCVEIAVGEAAVVARTVVALGAEKAMEGWSLDATGGAREPGSSRRVVSRRTPTPHRP